MNYKQVRALSDLMMWAQPPCRWGEVENPPHHVEVEVADGRDDGFGGSTYSAKVWSPDTGFAYPRRFFIRSDGTLYVYGFDTDEHVQFVVTASDLRWEPSSWRYVLVPKLDVRLDPQVSE